MIERCAAGICSGESAWGRSERSLRAALNCQGASVLSCRSQLWTLCDGPEQHFLAEARDKAMPQMITTSKVTPSHKDRAESRYWSVENVRGMDNQEFQQFVLDNVVEVSTSLKSNSIVPHTSQHDIEEYLTALHTANIVLQKRTEGYCWVFAADDKELNKEGSEPGSGDGATKYDPPVNVPSKGRSLWNIAKPQQMQKKALWRKVMEAASAGQKTRSELIERCRTDPRFMLEIGPVGA